MSTKTEREIPAPARPRDYVAEGREIVEFIVFLVVFVSLLKTFGVELFVIPTGSMATTMLGAHKTVVCPQCGQRNSINASQQAEGGFPILHGTCQNCRWPLKKAMEPAPANPLTDIVNAPFVKVVWRFVTGYADPTLVWEGDRVLVAKYLYEGLREPRRWEIVVFKYPALSGPGDRSHSSNTTFIKRLVGLPGETVRIYYGDLLLKNGGDQAKEGFVTARKPPDVVKAVRRLVFDNDLIPKDQLAGAVPPRWTPDDKENWTIAADGKSFAPTRAAGWLSYRHIIGGGQRLADEEPRLITDFEAYNSGSRDDRDQNNWVGDLNVDVNITVSTLKGKVVLELGEGTRRYRCVLDLAAGTATLEQNGKKLAERPSTIDRAGLWKVQFANFDDRLIVWVNDQLIFGDGVDVAPLTNSETGPRLSDLEPVRVGVDGASATLSGLKIYRDIYYTQTAHRGDYSHYDLESFVDPEPVLDRWRVGLLQRMEDPVEFTMNRNEFFTLGDNSTSSSDGREWLGTHVVPRHLLLGKALVSYWPPWSWNFAR